MKNSFKNNITLKLTQNIILNSKIIEQSNYELKTKYFSKDINKNENYEVGDSSNLFSDYLLNQLKYIDIELEIKEIIIYLIHNLSSNGYLDVYEILKKEFKLKKDSFEKAYEVLKSFDPSGVGALDLKDCLCIQLDNLKKNDLILKLLIKNHLPDLAEKNYSKITKKLKITECELIEKLKIIQTLNPIPSRGFDIDRQTNYIHPEATISLDKNGDYFIEINSEILNNLNNSNISPQIYSAIYKRQLLIENLLNKIKEKRLEDLTLTQLSKDLNVNNSIISRTIKNKYILFNNKIIPIKTFLTEHSCKEKTKKIIDQIINSTPEKLTDQQIKFILDSKGLNLSRRTINKYRNELKSEGKC